MKLKYILIAAASLLSASAQAQTDRCAIDLAVEVIQTGEEVPTQVSNRFQSKISNAMAKAGLTASNLPAERFFVAGRFDDAINDITGGPSQKVIVKTTLTVYIGDVKDEKIFASESFELKGVGNTDTQAYTNALNQIGPNNQKLVNFLETGHQKIVDYYDANYESIIQKAQTEPNFYEKMLLLTSIPTCCKGYSKVAPMITHYYNSWQNQEYDQILGQARAAWGADPTASGAQEALALISQIPSHANCAAEAKALGDKIAKTVQAQWTFENVTKYNNAVELERTRIQAAKEVSKEWARNQPKVVNRYTFISRRRY